LNKLLLFLFLVIPIGTASAQPAKGSPAGYSVLCVEEQAVGFNWENKRWVRKNFNGQTLLISRVPAEKYLNDKDKSVEVLLCEDRRTRDQTFDKVSFVNACYTMIQMGSKPNFLDSQMCIETWEGNKLARVSCENHTSKFAFEPAGGFIKQPWHMDVRSEEASKDSLSLGVGKCSPIN